MISYLYSDKTFFGDRLSGVCSFMMSSEGLFGISCCDTLVSMHIDTTPPANDIDFLSLLWICAYVVASLVR